MEKKPPPLMDNSSTSRRHRDSTSNKSKKPEPSSSSSRDRDSRYIERILGLIFDSIGAEDDSKAAAGGSLHQNLNQYTLSFNLLYIILKPHLFFFSRVYASGISSWSRTTVPENDRHCILNGGHNWRCKKARTLCGHHYAQKMVKLRRSRCNSSAISQQQPSHSIVEVSTW